MARKIKSFLSYAPLFLPPLILTLLYVFGFRFVVVLTDSMEPSIPTYSLVVTAPTWVLSPSNGSVILYRLYLPNNASFMVLHRVVGTTGNYLLTKGDNRGFRDPWYVGRDDVVGVVVLTIPYLGVALLILKFFIPHIIIGYVVYYTLRRWVFNA